MSHEFTVSEEHGEKLYKLIMARLPHHEAIKIVSKEDFAERIHFHIYIGRLDPDTGEVMTQELKFKSNDEGVTKEDFDEVVRDIHAKLPPGSKYDVHDLSGSLSVREQLNVGMNKGVMNIIKDVQLDAEIGQKGDKED